MSVQSLEHFKLNELLSMVSNVKINKIELEKDRIEILKQLHNISTKSNHIIAKLLLQQDEILKKRYQDWKLNGTVEEYTQPRSLYQWVNLHKESLGFGEKQARRYIQLHEDTEENPVIGEKLGTKKNDIIRRVPKEYRSDLRQKAVDDNWSAIRVEKEVQKIREKENKSDTLKKIKPHLPLINIKLDNKHKGKIIIEIDPAYRDTFNNIFQEKYIQKIRQEMYVTSNSVA
jgi:hypothetical protein